MHGTATGQRREQLMLRALDVMHAFIVGHRERGGAHQLGDICARQQRRHAAHRDAVRRQARELEAAARPILFLLEQSIEHGFGQHYRHWFEKRCASLLRPA